MDKQKLPPGPRPRVKRAPPPGDFIALGKSISSKPRMSGEVDVKSSQAPIRKTTLSTSSFLSGSQKRKDINPVNPIAPKQARTFSPSFNRTKEPTKSLDTGDPISAVKLVDAQPAELEELVQTADAKGDHDQVEGLLCGAMRTLKLNRLKPDPMLYLSLANLAKLNPNLFASKRVMEHLLQFLRRENTGSAVKPKANTLLCIMTCNILLHAFQNEDTWPQSFMKVYVEDALGDRSWVDNEYNKVFVSNITAVFGTVLPMRQTSQVASAAKGSLDTSSGQINVAFGKGDEEKILEEVGISLEADEPPGIQNRYQLHKDELAIQTYIHEIVKEQLNKRQMIDSVSRNLLRFITSVCGYVDVRLLASQRVETWLQNPKLTRPAQELLMSVALNCNTHTADDVEVIANLVRLRLKAKPVANQYINCVKEMICQHSDNLGTTLKHIIYNELSQQRNPNNMSILSVIFTGEPDAAAKYLSLVFQDLLCNREDYLRALRALFREIVRSLKYEVNMVEFCRGMMQERKETVFSELDRPYKERMLSSVIDLICLGCFLCVSPVVKELAISLSKGEKRDYSVLQAFQTQVSIIQRDAIWFFHTKFIQMYNCSEREFVLNLNKVLFLESNDQYSVKDNWPPEAERNTLLQLVREVPLAEDGLLRLHLLGLSEDVPINCADTLDVIERMVLRSALLKSGLQGLDIERTEVLNMLLSLSAYAHPREIMLPTGYTAPPLAIKTLYFKAWLILLVLAATNPTTIGSNVWGTYPTARCMMEMLITGSYEFPPLGVGELSAQDLRGNDLQVLRAEKDDIVVFEGHLAAATSHAVITESSSLLISQLISLDPSGPPRLPPAQVIDRLKNFNETFGLGKMLCRSREPDFLLSIIQSQGSSRSMPWLADLVQSSEGSLHALPVQCLCEFLLMKHNVTESHHSKQRSIKAKVAARLQDLLLGSEANAQSSNELIKYFIQRWSSGEMRDREASVDGLQSILLLQKKIRISLSDEHMDLDDEMKASRKHSRMQIIKDNTYTWLHEKLPNLPYFNDVAAEVLMALRKSLYVEVNIPRLQAYILFLTKYYGKGEEFLHSLIEDMSQLLTCRTTIMRSLVSRTTSHGESTYNSLLDFFAGYIQSELKPLSGEIQWHDSAEMLTVTWNGNALHAGKTAVLHSRVIHASIVLLTLGPAVSNQENYHLLLQTWFPTDGSYEVQQADTGDRIKLLERWLRMLLVQSGLEILVEAGLKGLPSNQLIMFLQTSGFPVNSMSKLLGMLDSAVDTEAQTLLRAAVDRDYLIQKVEVAQSCGARGGMKFCTLLQNDYEKEMDALTVEEIANDLSVCVMSKKRPEQTKALSDKTFTEENVREILSLVFAKKKTTSITKQYFNLKQKIAVEGISKNNSDFKVSDWVLTILNELTDNRRFLNKFCANKKEAMSILLHMSRMKISSNKHFTSLLKKLKTSEQKSTEMERLVNNLCAVHRITDTSSTPDKNVVKLLNEFLIVSSKAEDITHDTKRLMTKLQACDIEEIPKEKIVEVCKIVSEKSKFLFESFIYALCTGFKNQRSVKSCVEVLVEVIQAMDQKSSGLLIDWLSILDPEILHVNPILQRELLLTERNMVSANMEAMNRSDISYLTSILTHQTKNSTLDDCLTWMLNSSRDINSLNATSCLDLLSAMMNSPRLWQGRENKLDNVEEEKQDYFGCEDQIELDLSVHQLYRLIQLILSELNTIMKADQESDKTSSVDEVMDKRLHLLLNLCKKDSKRLQKALNMTRQIKKFPEVVMLCFMKYLYMKRPTLLPDLSEEFISNETTNSLPEENKTEMDKFIHRLILSISEPTGTPAWEGKFKSISAINRRLAVRHPYAFSRQLPLLLSMMKGKSRLSPGTFKLTNELMFCTHVFGLFDLLRPHVFAENERSKEVLVLFLDVFLELIMSPCLSADERAVFVNKLVEFLNHYISSGNKDAATVLKKHEYIFRDLLYDFPNFQGLTSICALTGTFDAMSSSSMQHSLLALHVSPFNEMQMSSFKRRLSMDHHHKDLISVIHDLDETSKRRVDILQHFSDELSKLIFSSDEEVRDKSHMLLIRHCKQQPRNSGRLIDLYLECFDSNNPDILLSAAKHSPQMILLSDEKCDVLLKRMYIISITSLTEIGKYVIDTIKNFNMDYA